MAKDPDAYLATLHADKRATLEAVRAAIRAAAPGAVEGMSYGMPAFILGKPIAGYAAAAGHCSYFPMSGAITTALKRDLEGYETSKGAVRFPVGRPLPAALIRKLVRARIAEIQASGRPARAAAKPAERVDPAVSAWLRTLDHPLKKEIEAVRRILLDASPSIREGIKWNAPSFRTDKDYFATVLVRSKEQVQVVLHRGARARAPRTPLSIADPKGLLKWLGRDRALATLGAGRDLAARRSALTAIVRSWIRHV